jgi:glucosamine-6-phosphate deaminase
MGSVLQFKVDNLVTKVFSDRAFLGKIAAINMAAKVEEMLGKKGEIRMVFAAAPSQNEFLAEFVKHDLEWEKITAFHMDEYIGLPAGSEQSFGYYLKEHLFKHVNFKNVFYMNSVNDDAAAECKRYSDLINEKPIDIVCMGIGENGHIAFNDPPVADFNDTETVKVVELDEACRQQQVNDGCFSSIELVPKHALTLTIPAMLSAEYLSVVVPGKTKAEAVYKTLDDEISTDCPATILRRHKDVVLYLDRDSYKVDGKVGNSSKEI